MSFKNLLPTEVNVHRLTDVLKSNATITTSMSLTRQPSGVSVKLLFKVTGGTNGSGSFTVIGTVNGVSTSEVVQFGSVGFKESTNLFSDVTNITSTGFTNESTVANLEILARSAAGQPVFQEYVAFTRNMRITGIKTSRFQYRFAGPIADATNVAYTTYVSSELILEHDIFVLLDGSRFEVLPFDLPWDRYKIHHYQIPIKQLI